MPLLQKSDYLPETLKDALVYFNDEQKCFDFLVEMRWPDGIWCPRCKSNIHSFIQTRKLWHCKSCKKQFSIKLGTIMEDSPLSLSKWVAAMWLISNAKNGISSYELHRALGVTQKTAWFMLHRIRYAMEYGTIEMVSGECEVDETFVGGLAKNMHKHRREEKIKGRGPTGKAIVMGILLRGDRKTKEQKKRKIGRHSKVQHKVCGSCGGIPYVA